MSRLGIVARGVLVIGALAWGGCHGAAPPPEHAGTSAPDDGARLKSLRDRASRAYNRGNASQCSHLVTKAGQIAPPEGRTAYNDACCHALAGHADPAFSLLTRAISTSYLEADWLVADPDLQSLHQDARWAPLLEEAKRAHASRLSTINLELYELLLADTAFQYSETDGTDRRQGYMQSVQRRDRVRAIVEAGEAKVAADFHHASLVLKWGTMPEDYAETYAFAMRAVELEPENRTMRRHAANSEDRLLHSQRKPQRYGSIYVRAGNYGERWELYTIDPSVTDEQRRAWGYPPLAESLAEARRMTAENFLPMPDPP